MFLVLEREINVPSNLHYNNCVEIESPVKISDTIRICLIFYQRYSLLRCDVAPDSIITSYIEKENPKGISQLLTGLGYIRRGIGCNIRIYAKLYTLGRADCFLEHLQISE